VSIRDGERSQWEAAAVHLFITLVPCLHFLEQTREKWERRTDGRKANSACKDADVCCVSSERHVLKIEIRLYSTLLDNFSAFSSYIVHLQVSASYVNDLLKLLQLISGGTHRSMLNVY